MKTLFLAWQAPTSCAWYPVGRLDADRQRSEYQFEYTQGAVEAAKKDGFHPISAFPDLDRRYEASELFPLFQNRVLDPHRKGFAEYLQSLDLDASRSDPIEILAVSGGERSTDNFEVFPKLEQQAGGQFVTRFFLHGLRHCAESLRQRALALEPKEELRISIELNNPATGVAVQLSTMDYQFVGWSPRYLVNDLLKAASQSFRDLSARVIRNNDLGTPPNRRILVELTGVFPDGYEPMSGKPFAAISGATEPAAVA
jgi:hypothetical protein